MSEPIKTIDAMFSCARESPSVATSHEQVMDAWAKVKALALFGRATLRRLADKHGTTVDDIANDACLLKGVRRHPNDEGPFITGELEPWLAQPEQPERPEQPAEEGGGA